MNAILVVEDDPDISESVQDALAGEGFEVMTAANGLEGLERLRELDKPCLILLDLMMPVMSGGEFLVALRERGLDATHPVVIMSAWPKEADQVADQTRGFIKKPVSLETLLGVAHEFCAVEEERR